MFIKFRTSILFAIFCVNFYGSAQSQSNENNLRLQMQLTQPDTNVLKFKVIVTNPGLKKVNVTVSSNEFGFIHSRTVSDPAYAVNYDFTGAEDGNYKIEVMAGKEKIVKEISIRTEVQVNRLVTFSGQRRQEKLAF